MTKLSFAVSNYKQLCQKVYSWARRIYVLSGTDLMSKQLQKKMYIHKKHQLRLKCPALELFLIPLELTVLCRFPF